MIEQIPQDIGFFIAGFTEGEGSFNISFRKRADYRLNWKITPAFNLSQIEPTVLSCCQEYLSCGVIRQRSDGIWYYEVQNLSDLTERVIPFFQHYSLKAPTKRHNFNTFAKIVELMTQQKHLCVEGIREIAELRYTMNNRGKRTHTKKDIMASLP